MNGWQFLEHYDKLDKNKNSDALIIMLTASVNNNDQRKAETFQSIKKFINKPLNNQDIKEILTLLE